MNKRKTDSKLRDIVKFAKRKGATYARIVDSKDIVVDKRVRLKCSVPLCSSYERNLMCPPNVIGVDEFADVLSLYQKALIVQVEADYDSSDKSKGGLDSKLCDELDRSTASANWQRRLHRLVNQLETESFKKGFYLAAGFTGGECTLCPECVSVQSRSPCRHPFEARPSMEAVGIDVVRTCAQIGLSVKLSSRQKVRWTGMVLLY